MITPEGPRYSKDHEWVRVEGDRAVIELPTGSVQIEVLDIRTIVGT